MGLERYRDIVDDYAEFQRACEQPLPTCIWANPTRTTGEELTGCLDRLGYPWRPSAAFDDTYLLPSWVNPGSTPEYVLGHYHVQEEVAQTALPALDPKPGERVLDLCAAPGNKTAQIGIAMKNRGTLVANELRRSRVKSLRFNLERLGVYNVLIVEGNGSGFPLTAGPLDRVLVDAPCTCEGTVRRFPGVTERVDDDSRLRAIRTQEHLLRRAIRLTRPGGCVVYSTCTFAPEENEGVVDNVLAGQGHIVPFSIGLRSSHGLSSWQGRVFREDMANAKRFYPHQNDTGGFFVAKIIVDEPQVPRGSRRTTGTCRFEELASDEPLAFWEERFGVGADALEHLRFYHTGSRVIWATHRDLEIPAGLNPEAVGMVFLRTRAGFLKPTSASLFVLGHLANQNIVELGADHVMPFLSGARFPWPGHGITPGFVVVRNESRVLGCGLWLGGHLSSQIPKAWRLRATA